MTSLDQTQFQEFNKILATSTTPVASGTLAALITSMVTAFSKKLQQLLVQRNQQLNTTEITPPRLPTLQTLDSLEKAFFDLANQDMNAVAELLLVIRKEKDLVTDKQGVLVEAINVPLSLLQKMWLLKEEIVKLHQHITLQKNDPLIADSNMISLILDACMNSVIGIIEGNLLRLPDTTLREELSSKLSSYKINSTD